MVIVRIYRNREHHITRFWVSGHAEFDQEGKDIVCAGVSAVTQTAVVGLMNHLQAALHFERNKGHLLCELPAGLPAVEQERAQIILTTMEAGLMALKASYPGFLKIEKKQGGVVHVQD